MSDIVFVCPWVYARQLSPLPMKAPSELHVLINIPPEELVSDPGNGAKLVNCFHALLGEAVGALNLPDDISVSACVYQVLTETGYEGAICIKQSSFDPQEIVDRIQRVLRMQCPSATVQEDQLA